MCHVSCSLFSRIHNVLSCYFPNTIFENSKHAVMISLGGRNACSHVVAGEIGTSLISWGPRPTITDDTFD